MKKQPTNKTGVVTEQAINKVLKVELDAQKLITQCEADAENILDQARQTARRINDRNNNRITMIHERYNRRIADEVASMKAASKQRTTDRQKDEFDQVAMSEVLNRIASALTTSQFTEARTEKQKERE